MATASNDIVFVIPGQAEAVAPGRGASRGSVKAAVRVGTTRAGGQKLIAQGANHLPITDARMTRFWITLDQGVDFVLSSLGLMQGGELFVPKIPAMRMTDLALSMAPHLPHKIIGIRPGEKLHEVMITTDDAPQTLELADRYVVQPALSWWHAEGHASRGKPVRGSFRYGSDNNPDRLDCARLQAMLAAAA